MSALHTHLLVFLYLLTFLASAPKLRDDWAEHGAHSHLTPSTTGLIATLSLDLLTHLGGGVPDIHDSSTDVQLYDSE